MDGMRNSLPKTGFPVWRAEAGDAMGSGRALGYAF